MDIQKQLNANKFLQEQGELEETYFEHRLQADVFPASKLSDNWRSMARRAIINTAPMMLRISLKDLALVMDALPRLEKGNDLTLFEFGVLSNSLETKSTKELGLSPKEYSELIHEALEHIEYYNKRLVVIREEVKKRAHNDMKMKSVALAASENPLKSVKAEA